MEGEERSDYTKAESRQIRQRSLKLLGSLVRPVRAKLAFIMVVVVVSTALQVLGPALIAYGINVGLPAILEQRRLVPARCSRWRPTSTAGVGGALLIAWYTVLTARVSQALLFDLRKRVFLHTQRLSLEFHERYTSGRIIARQTSDLDAIKEFFDSGLTQLVTGVLYMVFIAVALFIARLDERADPVRCSSSRSPCSPAGSR